MRTQRIAAFALAALFLCAHGWLVGHASDSRGFYLLLDGRDCTWSEVHQEVQSLCAQHFSNIFLE